MSALQGRPGGRLTSTPGGRPCLLAALGALGGAGLMVGSALPWLSMFAGLHSLGGLAGLNGRALFAVGAVTTLVAMRFLWRPSVRLRWVLGFLGAGALALASSLLVQLFKIRDALASEPLLLLGQGPGLFVATSGAALVLGTLFVCWDPQSWPASSALGTVHRRATRRHHHGRHG